MLRCEESRRGLAVGQSNADAVRVMADCTTAAPSAAPTAPSAEPSPSPSMAPSTVPSVSPAAPSTVPTAMPTSFVGQAAAPVLLSALFTSTFEAINVTFDADTDLGGQDAVKFNCSAMVDATTVSALGDVDSVHCRWVDRRTLLAVLGASASIALSDQFGLRPGVLKVAASNSLAMAAAGVAVGLTGGVLPAVEAVVNAPAQVGACSRLTLDASGSTGGAGRPLSFEWSLISSVFGLGLQLTDIFNGTENEATPAAILLPSAMTYTFQCRVTSWLNASSVANVTVTKASLALPTVVIAGPAMVDVRADQALLLSPDVHMPSACGDENVSETDVRYRWVQVLNVTANMSAILPASLQSYFSLLDMTVASMLLSAVALPPNTTSRELLFPPNVLSGNASYLLELSAFTPSGVARAYVGVRVSPGPLMALLSSGSLQEVQVSADPGALQLDASQSYDVGNPSDVTGIAYHWSCIELPSQIPCLGNASWPSAPVINVSTHALYNAFGSLKFLFSVKVISLVDWAVTMTDVCFRCRSQRTHARALRCKPPCSFLFRP